MAELSNGSNELWLSPVSVWEALALMQKGRIRVENPLAWVERAADQLRSRSLTHSIVRTSFALGLPHADPADRFLANKAKVLFYSLVTAEVGLLGLKNRASLAS